MDKLYKLTESGLSYHEAWENDSIVYEHWGIVGERGTTREHGLPRDKSAAEAIADILQPAVLEGFKAVDIDEHEVLLIEYSIDGMGDADDLVKRHALEDRMNETLGWTGVGLCDGGSIGSGTMEVCCLVVDFDIAKKTIEADLAGTEFSDFGRIYNEGKAG